MATLSRRLKNLCKIWQINLVGISSPARLHPHTQEPCQIRHQLLLLKLILSDNLDRPHRQKYVILFITQHQALVGSEQGLTRIPQRNHPHIPATYHPSGSNFVFDQARIRMLLENSMWLAHKRTRAFSKRLAISIKLVEKYIDFSTASLCVQ